MQNDELNDVINSVFKAIQNQFGNRIKDIEIVNVVDVPSYWAFNINFIAYNYFFVVFTYDLGSIGFSLILNQKHPVSLLNSSDWYSNIDFDKYFQMVQDNLESRIPDKYLKAYGWKN